MSASVTSRCFRRCTTRRYIIFNSFPSLPPANRVLVTRGYASRLAARVIHPSARSMFRNRFAGNWPCHAKRGWPILEAKLLGDETADPKGRLSDFETYSRGCLTAPCDDIATAGTMGR